MHYLLCFGVGLLVMAVILVVGIPIVTLFGWLASKFVPFKWGEMLGIATLILLLIFLFTRLGCEVLK